MKKVLIINLGKQYGGAEKVVEKLLNYNENSILAIDVNGKFIRELDSNRLLKCSTKGINIISSIFSIKKYIKDNDIKIIHCHGIAAELIGVLIKKTTNVKCIVTVHSDLNYDFTGIKKNIYRIINKVALNNADKIITVSNDLKEKVVKYTSNKNISMIYNGVDTIGNIIQKDNIKDKNRKKFLVVGRLTEVKNHLLIIRAAYIMKKRNLNFIVSIVGIGEKEEILKKKVDELKLNDYIKFEGFSDNINEYMQNSDALIMTSYMEGIPITILEAFSNKLLVISTNVGGIKEIIRNNFNGLLYQSDNELELANILSNFIENKIYKENIINNAYEIFMKKFSSEVMCQNYKKVYDKL